VEHGELRNEMLVKRHPLVLLTNEYSTHQCSVVHKQMIRKMVLSKRVVGNKFITIMSFAGCTSVDHEGGEVAG
jgi:hypothetical protein